MRPLVCIVSEMEALRLPPSARVWMPSSYEGPQELARRVASMSEGALYVIADTVKERARWRHNIGWLAYFEDKNVVTVNFKEKRRA